MRYAKSTRGFYPEDRQYPNLPADLITVTDDDYIAAMNLAVGETLDVVQGKLVIVPATPPDPAAILAAAKASGLDRIAAFAKAKRNLIAGTSDDAEIAAWSNKLRIAQAIGSGTATASEQSAFASEITARGITGETLAIFCQKVITNAAFFAQAVALIDGLKRRAQDAVKAAETPEAVETVLVAMKTQAEAAFTALLMGAR